MEEVVLQVRDLRTSFFTDEGEVKAVDGVSFDVPKGKTLGIVGESGSGKSITSLSILQLLASNGKIVGGEILFKGEDLTKLSDREMREIRGNDIAMIFQDPMTALNPLGTIGAQIEEPMKYHMKEMSKSERKERAMDLLRRVGIRNEERVYSQYPHQLSGGMRQRVVIAIAMACDPVLLIADEPTTALDVTIQAQIMDLMKELQDEMESGIILITHDLGVVAEMADRVAVMYAGQIVEIAEVKELFRNPMHPYTRSLLNSLPSGTEGKERLHVIDGVVPALQNLDRSGCRFAPRIAWIPESAHIPNPPLEEVEPNHHVRCTCYKHFYFPEEKQGEVNNVTT